MTAIRWVDRIGTSLLHMVVFWAAACLLFLDLTGHFLLPTWLRGGVVLLLIADITLGIILGFRAERARVRGLAEVAARLGMKFAAKAPRDNDPLAATEIPLLKGRSGEPWNILTGPDVVMFDLRTSSGKSSSTRTVVYFPEPLAGLSDFQPTIFAYRIPGSYATAFADQPTLRAQAAGGRLIVFRPNRLIHPDGVAELLVAARRIRKELGRLGPLT